MKTEEETLAYLETWRWREPMEDLGVMDAMEHMANIKRALKSRIGNVPVKGDSTGFYVKCPECGTRSVLPNRQKYCTECGSRMLWEQYVWSRGMTHPDPGKTPMQAMWDALDQKTRVQQLEERMKKNEK